ncbi:sensor histidine kinase [Kordiimonas laminariae]|uniref:sensor histidine kinase n=1 Tax=Kordiimonas laminariae TaxID=2917717 RepID=UPI001FF62E70|nr:ATP-binding protein [Kordiimonas laminariae]MCK0067950.1 ATP-binding protein [Kordiimonas laminariae]
MDKGFIYIFAGCIFLSLSSGLDYADTYIDVVKNWIRNDIDQRLYRSGIVIFGYFPGIVLMGLGFRNWLALTFRLEEEIKQRSEIEQELKELAKSNEEMAEKAKAANRAKSDFLANMSHELRTPLNAIIGFSELMASEVFGKLGAPQYKEYLDMVHRSGSHLLDIINDILDLSNIEVGRMQMVEEVFCLSKLVRDCVKLLDPIILKAGLQTEISLKEGLIVKADRRMVQQMVLNLISNAIKFTDPGGKVTVATLPMPDDSCAFMVKDTGCGMSEAEVVHVVRPFNQLEGAMTRSHEGAGLGLTLVKTFAELHGGDMFLESLKNRGTSVCLKFPPSRMVQPSSLEASAKLETSAEAYDELSSYQRVTENPEDKFQENL